MLRIRPDPNLFGRLRIRSNRPDLTKKCQKKKFCIIILIDTVPIEKFTCFIFKKHGNQQILNKKQKIVNKTKQS